MTQQNTERSVVLITGGTKGIGIGITRAYLEKSYQVVICARTAPEKVIKVAGNKAHFIRTDLKNSESIENLFTTIKTQFGRLDVLINNAGGSPAVDASTVSPRFHSSIIHLNLVAPLQVAQEAYKLMQSSSTQGTIIFIGSVSALRASPGTAAYGAAKAGILSLVQSLAIEWAPNVRVLAVSPGLIKTEQSHLHYGDAAGIAAVEKNIPLQRLGTPNDVAKACLFASSEQASYMSGSNILLHGGGEAPAFLNSNDK